MIQYKNGDWKSFTIKQLWKGKLLMQKFGTEKFHGVNFAVFPHKGVLGSGEARKSMEEMAHKTEHTTVTRRAAFLRSRHVSTVNCDNGVWRARISFFDHDVPCEPKWGNWFESHIAFQKHYAQIAQRTGCELFLTGCEMTMTEHRETDWRKLIAEVRTVYDGPVGYNCDKYGEDHITWWDAVDVIASSGYYPIDDWENQLDRIEEVVKKYQKPFIFSEAGCMNIHGSALVPNNWELQGKEDDAEQADWYLAMFSACEKRDWVKGFGIWDWPGSMERKSPYAVCDRPAEAVIAEEYSRCAKNR